MKECKKHEWVSLAESGLKLCHPFEDCSQVPLKDYPGKSKWRVCKKCLTQEHKITGMGWVEYSGDMSVQKPKEQKCKNVTNNKNESNEKQNVIF